MVNKVVLIGRVGRDPELKTVGESLSTCQFSVATTERWTDKTGERKESTEWHKVVCWRKLAETCSTYLNKGKLVYVEGKLVTRKWEKDGVTRYATEVIADKVQFLGAKSDAAAVGEMPEVGEFVRSSNNVDPQSVEIPF